MADSHTPRNDDPQQDLPADEQEEYERIYEEANADEIPTEQIDVDADDTSTSQSKKGKVGQLDIDDIGAYISATKEKQTEKKTPLVAADGTELTGLEGIYAVVPHGKGDHKLVFLTDDAPDDLKDDPKGRTKGETYIKNETPIYEVKTTFKKHPTLTNTKSEPLDVWLIDEPKELQQQLDAISQGKGGGTNFGAPVVVLAAKDKKKATPAATKQETPSKKDETADKQAEKDGSSGPEAAEKKEATKKKDTSDTPPAKAKKETKKEGAEKTTDEKKKALTADKDTKEDTADKEDSAKATSSQKESSSGGAGDKKEDTSGDKEKTSDKKSPETDKKEKETTKQTNSKTEKEDKTKKNEEKQKPSDSKSADKTDKKEKTSGSDKEKPSVTPKKKQDDKKEATKKETKEKDAPKKDDTSQEKAGSSDDKKEKTPEQPEKEPVEVTKKRKEGFSFSGKEGKPEENDQEEEINNEEKAATNIGKSGMFRPAGEENEKDKETAKKKEQKSQKPTQPAKKEEESPKTDKKVDKKEGTPESPKEKKEADAPKQQPETPKEQPAEQKETPKEDKHTAVVDLDEFGPGEDEADKKESTSKKKKGSKLAALLPTSFNLSRKNIFRGIGAVVVLALLWGVYTVMFSTGGAEQPEDNPAPIGVDQNTGEQQQDELPDDTETPPTSDTPSDDEPDSGTFTLNQLQVKLESQEQQARQLLNRAKFLEHNDAIKFSMAALLRAGHALEDIRTDPSVTAIEIEDEVRQIDLYLAEVRKIME